MVDGRVGVVLESIIARSPGEPEFHQAVIEVVDHGNRQQLLAQSKFIKNTVCPTASEKL